MKKEIKKDIFFLFVVIAYSLQAIASAYSDSYIYVLGIIASAALLYVIKNRYLGAVAGLAVLAAMEFYNSHCKYMTVVAFLLICAHKELLSDITVSDKKSKKETSIFSFLSVQVCLFSAIALFVYSLVLTSENQSNVSIFYLNRSFFIYFWLVGIFVYSLFDSRKNKKEKHSKKINSQLSGNLRFMYLVSIIAFTATVLYCRAELSQIMLNHNVIFLPWFLFVCSLFYNDDPYIKSISETLENFIIKISNNDKVKK